MFPTTTVSEIIKTSQKDQEYLDLFQSKLDFFYSNSPLRIIFYVIITTYKHNQTLGEEVVDVIMTRNQVPISYLQRWLGMFLLLGSRCCLLWIGKEWIELVEKIHESLFFIQSKFYHVSKRLLNHQLLHISNKKPTNVTFTWLGWCKVSTLLLQCLLHLSSKKSKKIIHTIEMNDIVKPCRCTLCLEDEMKCPSVGDCGHVFCWDCICEWSRGTAHCPLCRQTIYTNHIYPLVNW
jgi:hypothetical protein